MGSSFKSCLLKDVRDVFLNTDEFADLLDIKYFSGGSKEPPLSLRIPAMIVEDADETKPKNNRDSYQLKNEQTLTQKSFILMVSHEYFVELPRRRRKVQVGKTMYEVASVAESEGLLKIKLRTLEE